MADRKFKSIQLLLSLSLGILTFSTLIQTVKADSPSCPNHQFHGTVSSGGHVVGSGYTVAAVVNGQQVASTTTDSQGKWGNEQPFVVNVPSGSVIEFYIDGKLIGSAAGCIATSELNLSAGGAPPPANPSTTASSSSSADSSPNPLPGGPNSSGVITSGSTITFLIGQQGSNSAASGSTTQGSSTQDSPADALPPTPTGTGANNPVSPTPPTAPSPPASSVASPPDTRSTTEKSGDANSSDNPTTPPAEKAEKPLDPIPILTAVAIGGLVIILIISRI